MFIRTERLLLRPGWPEDAPALAAAIGHESVAMKLARLPWPYTLAHAQDWLSQEPGGLPNLQILWRSEHALELVGGVGIHDQDGEPELGYWVTPAYWGRGIATEAGRALLNAAHMLGVTRVVSGHFVDNPASGRVLGKLGFVPTGLVEPRRCLARGTELPCATYTLHLRPTPAV